MHITVWNDYICPWAYAARPQTRWLREQLTSTGAGTLSTRSFELHPDLPEAGKEIRPGGRLDQVFDRIAVECSERSQDFVKPTRTPNSRMILGLAELVNRRHPDRFDAFDDAVARAHWVDSRAIDDPQVVSSLLTEAGLDPAELVNDEAAAEGLQLLADSRAEALAVGATATPSWQFGDLVITGLHDDQQFQRWFGRILERSA